MNPTEPEPAAQPERLSEAEQHARNLRFRDNRAVFNRSAAWLDSHREQALEPMAAHIANASPAAIGCARVLGKWNDPVVIPALAVGLSSRNDALAFEAARALARTDGEQATQALVEALKSPASSTVKNALRGAELRKDPALLPAVNAHLDGPHGEYAARAEAACRP